mmetsp:Transcript_22272/g.68326  ORF Transcript_22272/g.68326 Transcript_22272/m.68326 type:complete len:212 (-) Transcript_22272:2241-2876(-)
MGPSLKPWIFSTVRNRFSSISKCDSSCFFFLVLCFWIAARRAPLLPVCSGSLTSSSSSSGRFSLTLSKISTSVSLGGSRGSGLGGLTPAIMPARRIVVRAVCVSCSCSSRSSSALWALAARNVSSANLASASRSRLRAFRRRHSACGTPVTPSRRWRHRRTRGASEFEATASSERGDGVPGPVDAIAATIEEGRTPPQTYPSHPSPPATAD